MSTRRKCGNTSVLQLLLLLQGPFSAIGVSGAMSFVVEGITAVLPRYINKPISHVCILIHLRVAGTTGTIGCCETVKAIAIGLGAMKL